MKSKMVAKILALVFILGLSGVTIYSRTYAQRRKPLVDIGFAQSGSFVWEYVTRSTIQPASEEFAAFGVVWTIEVFLPHTAWIDYMSEPPALITYVVSENVGHRERTEIARVVLSENDDATIIFNYTSPFRAGRGDGVREQVWPGENVTVFMSPREFNAVSDSLVPTSAVHRNEFTGEYHIYTVSRRNGVWGREYVASRHRVSMDRPPRLGDMVNLRFLPPDDPIVFSSDRLLYHGAVVRIFD
ncbi:MAG: hypothetical protein FWB91_09025 [Defluviitaleaceae bacterium]|nr:hypothetical protein [Defluviitaleaceae bacterium]